MAVITGGVAVASSVLGHVVDESGGPVPKARVTVLLPNSDRSVSSTVTNEKGEYSIESIPAGLYLIRAEASGFVTVTYGPVSLPYAGAYERELRLALADTQEGGAWTAAKAVGRLDCDGSVLAGVELCFVSRFNRKCVVTDRNGEYAVDLDPGRYTVHAESLSGLAWNGIVEFPTVGYYENKLSVVRARP